ncbi:hypothetical protein [Actinomadura sp. 3N508]|uniref:hypothetical protein n=1 Tax=Actinomadura sp. 3N508 TaxID=3375153 RepID=UPI00379B14F8
MIIPRGSGAWPGPFPYDVLACAGVTPDTSHAAMQDVPFDLLARRAMTPEAQQAWNELRTVRRRMLADLMLYDADPAADLAAARAEVEAALRDPGEPPGVARCLELDPPLSPDLAAELDEVVLDPPPPIPAVRGFDDPVPPGFLDDLIRSDD